LADRIIVEAASPAIAAPALDQIIEIRRQQFRGRKSKMAIVGRFDIYLRDERPCANNALGRSGHRQTHGQQGHPQ
jgi:hypothetical protein